MALREQVLDRGARAADVVEQHRVGLDPPRRPVDEDDRGAGAELGQQVAVVVTGGNDEQAVDRRRSRRRTSSRSRSVSSSHEPVMRMWLSVAGGVLDAAERSSSRRGWRRPRSRGRAFGAPVAQRAGDVVASEAELARSLLTRAAVSGRTPGSLLTTRETVFRLTPALLATSLIVGLATLSSLLLDPDTHADNVVSASGAT